MKIFDVLKGLSGQVYLVGGAIRDEFLGRKSKDLDFLVTGMTYDELVSALGRYGRADVVGRQFGVVKFTMDGETHDVALPRREVSTGDGHRDFRVECGSDVPLEKDLERRDFTCNAIARCLRTGQVVDPFGGVEAIKEGRLTMVSDMSFKEDPLRMLRGVQFSSRFGFQLDESAWGRMKDNAHMISSVSVERIAEELAKLMRADAPSEGFRLMRETGVLSLILPEVSALTGLEQPKQHHIYDVFDHSLAALDSMPSEKLYLRWAALLHDIGKPGTLDHKPDGTPTFRGHAELGAEMARVLMSRLKLTSVGEDAMGTDRATDRICHMIDLHMFQCDLDSKSKSLRKFFFKATKGFDRRAVIDQIRLRIADRQAGRVNTEPEEVHRYWVEFAREIRRQARVLKGKDGFDRTDLKLDGHELMAMGVPQGPELKEVFGLLMEAVLDDPSKNNGRDLSRLVDDWICDNA